MNLAIIVKVWSLMEFDEEESKQMMAGVGISDLWPIRDQYSNYWPITGEHGQWELRELVGHGGPDQAHPRLQQDLLHITKGHKDYKFAKSLYLDQHFRNHFNYL